MGCWRVWRCMVGWIGVWGMTGGRWIQSESVRNMPSCVVAKESVDHDKGEFARIRGEYPWRHALQFKGKWRDLSEEARKKLQMGRRGARRLKMKHVPVNDGPAGVVISSNAAESCISRVRRHLRYVNIKSRDSNDYALALGEFCWRSRFLSEAEVGKDNWRKFAFWYLLDALCQAIGSDPEAESWAFDEELGSEVQVSGNRARLLTGSNAQQQWQSKATAPTTRRDVWQTWIDDTSELNQRKYARKRPRDERPDDPGTEKQATKSPKGCPRQGRDAANELDISQPWKRVSGKQLPAGAVPGSQSKPNEASGHASNPLKKPAAAPSVGGGNDAVPEGGRPESTGGLPDASSQVKCDQCDRSDCPGALESRRCPHYGGRSRAAHADARPKSREELAALASENALHRVKPPYRIASKQATYKGCPGDGDCCFWALSVRDDGGKGPDGAAMRASVLGHLRANPNERIIENITEETGETFQQYLKRMQKVIRGRAQKGASTWGGPPELAAWSIMTRRPVWVWRVEGRSAKRVYRRCEVFEPLDDGYCDALHPRHVLYGPGHYDALLMPLAIVQGAP